MRSVIFRYESVPALAAALSDPRGALPLPAGEVVADGEWVLAIFEIGSRRRATAAAARGVRSDAGARLDFERRDWERLLGFVAARSEHMRASRPVTSSSRVPIAPESSTYRPPDPTPRSRRFEESPPSSTLESSRVPFGARILVVEGDHATGEELRTMLAEMGLVVDVVASASGAAVAFGGAQIFDALVLDLHAAGLDARAFVASIRAHARGTDLPILFLSSKPSARDAVDAFASGGDDFLPKPFRTSELAARIFGLLRRARLARAAGGVDR